MRRETRDPRQLDTSNYLGLKFAEQGWWFIQILETEFIELKPWTLLNENDNRGEIAAQTAGSQDDEIQDAVDRHFVIPRDDEQNLVFQVQFGIAPSRVQVFPIFGRDRAPNLRGTAEPGEPQTPYTGFDSPYNNPSREAEFFTVNEMEFPSLQAYNPTDEPVEAQLSFHINKMKYATIEDEATQRALLEGQIPCRFAPMGLGAQQRDQLKVPNWLRDHFGSEIRSTEDILSATNGNGRGAVSQLQGGGGT
jgi:hypothetical protein